jgi:hypothetical protein
VIPDELSSVEKGPPPRSHESVASWSGSEPLGKIDDARRYVERMSSALSPDRMTADERLDEVAEILAVGLSRLRSRQSSALAADAGESSLDCAGHQSGHANVLKGGLD